MTTASLPTPGFSGLRVAAFESRMAAELSRLIERYGGHPLVAPILREVPLADHPAALELGRRLMAQDESPGLDMLILLTGIGTTALFDILQTRYPWPDLERALRRIALVARGPKPAAALKARGLRPTLTVPDPNTWVEVVSTLDEYRPVKGLQVAVQEYGIANPDLLEALRLRGAQVSSVPIYKWALPEDLTPVREALDAVIGGRVDVMLITNAAQVDHVMQMLRRDGKEEAFRTALTRIVIASIGPTASEHLRRLNWPVDLEPSHSKLGILVKESSEQAPRIHLERTRR